MPDQKIKTISHELLGINARRAIDHDDPDRDQDNHGHGDRYSNIPHLNDPTRHSEERFLRRTSFPKNFTEEAGTYLFLLKNLRKTMYEESHALDSSLRSE